MSTRYVWEKWNIIEDWIYKGSGNYGDGTSVVKAENFNGSISQACYYGNSVSYNGSQTILSGNVGRVNVSSTSSRDSESEIPAGKYVQSREINNEKIVYKSKGGSTYYQGRIYALPSYNDYDYGADLEFRNVDRYSFEKGKGSTSYGNISSGSSGAYPANSYSGTYWYVSKGSDTIDPVSVSLSGINSRRTNCRTLPSHPSTGTCIRRYRQIQGRVSAERWKLDSRKQRHRQPLHLSIGTGSG